MRSKTAHESHAITPIGVVAPPPILVQTPAFEGTLAALFRCVRDRKVDLMEVPLEPICQAYLEYLMDSPETNLDEAAAALTVLAYLLERKAWQLLPTEDEEPDYEEPAALPDPTAYAYSDVIQMLLGGHEERSKLFFRTSGPDPSLYEIPYSVGEVTVGDLARAFESLIRKSEPDEIDSLNKPRKSLVEQMRVVLLCLTKEFRPITALFVGSYTRNDAVYWFLSLLELIRLRQAAVKLEGEEVLFAKK